MRTINHKIKVLWDGNSALVVHKPAGIATQAAHGIESLETILRGQLADRTDYLAFPHRLDRPVSGVILVATGKRAARLLSDQFASRKVTKIYLAWVSGKVPSEELGDWVDHLRKVTDQSRSEIVKPGTEGGQVAETEASLRAYDPATNRSLLELSPRTGRMHQLRLQTAHRGFPIIGDWQYGGTRLEDESNNVDEKNSSEPGTPLGSLPASTTQSTIEAANHRRPPAVSSGNPTIKLPVPVGKTPALDSSPPTLDGKAQAHDGKAQALDEKAWAADRILLQAHQITFHAPSNGALQTVTASDEPPQSV